MSISGINDQVTNNLQNTLLSELKESGLSNTQAQNIALEVETVIHSSEEKDPVAVREAIEKQLSQDVKNGTLTQKEADTVSSALNEFESKIQSGSAPAGTPPAGGGGGSGGSESSTEVVDTETTTNDKGWTTKTITYADDSETVTREYDASKDKTITEEGKDGALAAIQGILKEKNADDKVVNYVNDLFSSGRLNIYA